MLLEGLDRAGKLAEQGVVSGTEPEDRERKQGGGAADGAADFGVEGRDVGIRLEQALGFRALAAAGDPDSALAVGCDLHQTGHEQAAGTARPVAALELLDATRERGGTLLREAAVLALAQVESGADLGGGELEVPAQLQHIALTLVEGVEQAPGDAGLVAGHDLLVERRRAVGQRLDARVVRADGRGYASAAERMERLGSGGREKIGAQRPDRLAPLALGEDTGPGVVVDGEPLVVVETREALRQHGHHRRAIALVFAARRLAPRPPHGATDRSGAGDSLAQRTGRRQNRLQAGAPMQGYRALYDQSTPPRLRQATGAGGDRPGGMGAASPPVSLGLYELIAGPFHGEGSVRVEAQGLVSRWVSGPSKRAETFGKTSFHQRPQWLKQSV